SLDISRNANLSRLDCSYNDLSSLDVSANVDLDDLDCGFNPLVSLDVSKNLNLRYLSLPRTQLATMDVSKNINLEGLYFSYNQLSSLDLSRNTALRYLDCDGNRLMSLDVSQQPELRCLSFANNRLTSLDLRAHTKLSSSYDAGNYWVSYKTEGNFLEVPLDGRRAYDLTALPGLDVERILLVKGGRIEGSRLIFEADEVEYCYMTGYEPENSWSSHHHFDTVWFRLVADKQDAPQIPLTAEFFPDSIFRAYVTAFDKDGNDSLCAHECAVVKEIRVGGACEGPLVYWRSGLRSLEGLRYFGNVEELICGAAELTSLDVSHNPALEEIYCPHNRLKTLVVSDKPALKYLYCYNNDLTTLTVSNCPKLEDLYCQKNSLTELE
ncbi:MAG: hypothetical protein K2H70_00605, partial [Bacteroidales bacterium]|nr:hypothetical protein [Bacteroidales bacterium]